MESDATTAKSSSLIGRGGYHANPAFLLTTEEKSSVVTLRVSQSDRRVATAVQTASSSSTSYTNGIQSHIFSAPESFLEAEALHDEQQLAKLSMLAESAVIASTNLVYSRDSFLEVTLHRHQPLVVIVASTGDHAGVEVCAVGYEQFDLTVVNRLPLARVIDGVERTDGCRTLSACQRNESTQYTISLPVSLTNPNELT